MYCFFFLTCSTHMAFNWREQPLEPSVRNVRQIFRWFVRWLTSGALVYRSKSILLPNSGACEEHPWCRYVWWRLIGSLYCWRLFTVGLTVYAPEASHLFGCLSGDSQTNGVEILLWSCRGWKWLCYSCRIVPVLYFHCLAFRFLNLSDQNCWKYFFKSWHLDFIFHAELRNPNCFCFELNSKIILSQQAVTAISLTGNCRFSCWLCCYCVSDFATLSNQRKNISHPCKAGTYIWKLTRPDTTASYYMALFLHPALRMR